jgi:hypothetical protein
MKINKKQREKSYIKKSQKTSKSCVENMDPNMRHMFFENKFENFCF